MQAMLLTQRVQRATKQRTADYSAGFTKTAQLSLGKGTDSAPSSRAVVDIARSLRA